MTEAFSPSAGHDLWQNCVDHLAQELPEQQFNTWIKPLVVEVNKDLSKVTIQVGNRFKLDWVRAQYASRIVALLEKVTGQSITLELALAPREDVAKSTPFPQNFKILGAPEPSGLALSALSPAPRLYPTACGRGTQMRRRPCRANVPKTAAAVPSPSR